MRVALLAIAMLASTLTLAAEDLLGLIVGEEAASSLRAGAPVRRSIPSDGSVSLVPAVSIRAAVQEAMRTFHPTIGVEMLRFVPWPHALPPGPQRWLQLFNILHAASTMQGTRYWSVTRGREETLFLQSYAIDAPGSTARKIDDPVFSTVPPQDTLYTFQEDKSFGKNRYLETFSFPGDSVSVRVENLTTVTLLFVPVIPARAFVVRVILVPAGEGLIFYGAAVIRTTFPLGNRRSREDSLANRLDAMGNWLQGRLALP